MKTFLRLLYSSCENLRAQFLLAEYLGQCEQFIIKRSIHDDFNGFLSQVGTLNRFFR